MRSSLHHLANTNNLADLDAQPWDANVKVVARIPVLLQKMNEDLDRTIQLGQAFLEQPMAVMSAIQPSRAIFGPVVMEMVNPDRVQATNEYATVAAALSAGHRVVREADGRWVVEIGPERWPLPIPLVQRDGRWSFDTAAGKEELLNRRVGRNELAVLAVMRAYVAAQREYASRDRDGDEVLEFASRGSTGVPPSERPGPDAHQPLECGDSL